MDLVQADTSVTPGLDEKLIMDTSFKIEFLSRYWSQYYVVKI